MAYWILVAKRSMIILSDNWASPLTYPYVSHLRYDHEARLFTGELESSASYSTRHTVDTHKPCHDGLPQSD